MKEQLLATKDEVIVRDLYPIIVTNRRLYICEGKKKNFSSVSIKRIIQIDKITAIKYHLIKRPFLKTLALLSFFFAILCGVLAFYNKFHEPVSEEMFMYGLYGLGGFLTLFVLFLILYATLRIKIIWIEYPTNLDHSSYAVYKKGALKAFQDLVSAVFEVSDKLKETTQKPFENQ
jgi:hypothetical protein